MGYSGYGFGPLGMIWVVIPIAAVALAVWLVLSLAALGIHHMPRRRSAGLDLLDERYARGEINRDEYLQKKQDMGG